MSETDTITSWFDFGAKQARLLSLFLPMTASAVGDVEVMDGFARSQNQLRHSVEANLALWRGAATASVNSFESLGRCLTGSRDDFLHAASATSPTEFSRRQISALVGRHRELVGELRSIADQLNETWFQAMENVSFPKPGAVEAPHPVPAAAEEVIEPAETSQRAEPLAGVDSPERPDNGSRRPLPRGRQKDA